ncbi:MAG: 2-deoxy-D-gluconate 3-dehydrogenase [Acidimicrobiales bacterium]|nr:MAG: 2-deoxy-D-gluconate 3-dehydrogenase [Acidimicrobiales bacterium]
MYDLTLQRLFSVEGKTALVTGGSRGIGEMIAAGLLANGAKVYVSSRKADVCKSTAEKLSAEFGGECVAIPGDVATLEGVDALAGEIRQREERLHILVNNAGVSWGAPLEEFPEIGWDKVFDTNVKGTFFLTQRLLSLLESAGTPEDPARVVNIGSIDGMKTPAFETFSYGPSKAAVHHLTRQLAAKLVRRNILVNAIAPGPFPTWMLSTGIGTRGDVEGTDWEAVGRMNPRGRVGSPEDIAGTVLFLCSRAGAYVVGDVIVVDGGMVASA